MNDANELTTNQAFDDYASRFRWNYDNGGWYRGLGWDRYASNGPRWERLPTGTVNQTVEIMRRGDTRVCAVHFRGREPHEIWSGDIRTGSDFDRLLAIITDYMTRQDTSA